MACSYGAVRPYSNNRVEELSLSELSELRHPHLEYTRPASYIQSPLLPYRTSLWPWSARSRLSMSSHRENWLDFVFSSLLYIIPRINKPVTI